MQLHAVVLLDVLRRVVLERGTTMLAFCSTYLCARSRAEVWTTGDASRMMRRNTLDAGYGHDVLNPPSSLAQPQHRRASMMTVRWEEGGGGGI